MRPSEQIHSAAMSWLGVTAQPHRFGGTEYRFGKREIGHIHGDHLVDIPFPKNVRNEVVAAGIAEPHHILPNSGWISFYIKRADQVESAIALLRRSYDLATARKASAA
ncbi:MAG TPA: luciferase family protein [Chthoniobacterales bacterium]|nr:luciferase family protein [Chthoniobacterales bacterium]